MVQQLPNRPGEFFVPELGRVIRITDVRQDDFYDSVETNTGLLTAGTQHKVFDTFTNKSKQHTNLTTLRRIPGRNKFNLLRVGVLVRQAWGAVTSTYADTLAIYDQAAIKFSINTRLVTEGPLLRYQSGYGVTGALATTVNATSQAVLTLGVPSQAAAPKFMAAQPINDEDDLDCEIRFDGNTWLTTTTLPTLSQRNVISVFLSGIVEKPITT